MTKKKKLLILCFMINALTLQNSWATEDITYETCINYSNCTGCGTYCRYIKNEDGDVTVYGPTQKGEDGKIPEGIISTNAFFQKNINSLKFDGNIVDTGTAAFQYISVPKHTTIVIPDSVKTIGPASFFGVYNIDVVIPDSVTEIRPNAFSSYMNNIYCSETKKALCQSSLPSPWFEESSLEYVLKIYQKDGGAYVLTDEDGNKTYYSSPADMANGTNICTNITDCKATALSNDGKLCKTFDECKALVEATDAGSVFIKGKFYATLNDLINGEYEKKRIYTIDEANAVAGDKNRVSIRYK